MLVFVKGKYDTVIDTRSGVVHSKYEYEYYLQAFDGVYGEFFFCVCEKYIVAL